MLYFTDQCLIIEFRGQGEENPIFKATMAVLLFFFNLLHWSCFVSLSQGLPHIDTLRAESEIEIKYLSNISSTLIPMKHNLHQVIEHEKSFLVYISINNSKPRRQNQNTTFLFIYF